MTIESGLFRTIAVTERLMTAVGSPLSELRNFLLPQHSTALGSVIHATPLLAALRHAVPDCRIVVVASGFSRDVFRDNPFVERVIATPSPLTDLKGAVRALRAERPFRGLPHAVLTSTGNERTRILAQAIFATSATRIGFTVTPHLYCVPLAFDYSRSQIANNLRIPQALGHLVPHFEPQLYFTAEDLHHARQTLAASGVLPSEPVAIFITQTSVTQRKSWRAERFQAAAKHLAERHKAHIVFVGTAKEAPLIDQLRSSLPFDTISVAGQTPLPQLAALMSLATIGLSLDTGPLHVGRAVGLPMVVIAPAWSPPIEWLPLNNPRYRILKNLDMPAATSDYIIDEVSVDEVTAALDDLMSRYPKRLAED